MKIEFWEIILYFYELYLTYKHLKLMSELNGTGVIT